MVIDLANVSEMHSRHRANFFNSLSGYKSANLISTLSEDKLSNLAIFNSVIHIGANPPLMGFILRPVTVERHTYSNILSEGYYTINHVHDAMIEKAHQTSAKYPQNISEYEKCGLTEEYLNEFPVPFVKESNIKIGLKFIEEQVIRANGTHLIIGEVQELKLHSLLIEEDGSINLPEANTVAISGLDTYLKAEKLLKLPYARA